MKIDPQGKLAKQAEVRERRRTAYAKKMAKRAEIKRGAVSNVDKGIVGHLMRDEPSPSPAQVNALSTLLHHKPATIRKTIQEARETFQQNAKEYVALHMKAARSDDPDVSRKAAQWAIEHIAAKDAEGNVERIVEPPTAEDSRPSIQIGINLGGMPVRQAVPTLVDFEEGEVE